MRYLVLFLALLATGPAPWYVLDAVQHGPTSANVPWLPPALGLYAIWCAAALLLRPARGASFEIGCLLSLASGVATAVLVVLATSLPVPLDGRLVSETGILMLGYFPWLLLQYVLFVAAWTVSARGR